MPDQISDPVSDEELVARFAGHPVDHDRAAHYRPRPERRLCLRRCADCATWPHPPRPVCPPCRPAGPAALPESFAPRRISTGTAIAVLFFSESVAGSNGLGWYIMDAWGRVAYGAMFAGIIAMAILGVVLYELIEALELSLCRWTRAGRSADETQF